MLPTSDQQFALLPAAVSMFARSSTGLGARADWDNGVSGNVYVAFPLTRDVQTEGDDGPRIFAGVQRTF